MEKIIHGVIAAVVVETRDPENRRRVRVRLPPPADPAEKWARVATAACCASNPATGLIVQDEVLVAFDHGDVNQPFVVGVLWDNNAPPTPSKASKVDLPIGGSLYGISADDNTPTDCARTASLLQQTAPWLASMTCLLGVLKLLKPLIEVIESLPTVSAAALREFKKEATNLHPCLLLPEPAAPSICPRASLPDSPVVAMSYRRNNDPADIGGGDRSHPGSYRSRAAILCDCRHSVRAAVCACESHLTSASERYCRYRSNSRNTRRVRRLMGDSSGGSLL